MVIVGTIRSPYRCSRVAIDQFLLGPAFVYVGLVVLGNVGRDRVAWRVFPTGSPPLEAWLSEPRPGLEL